MADLSADLVRDLAVQRPGAPVLSLYARTDPRDPANMAADPGWLIGVRNGLREVSRAAEERAARDDRLALRGLHERAERDLTALDPAARGRGQAWFLTADGSLDLRLTLQVPPASTLVRWDDLPFVSPLVDVADRGRAAGLVLVSTEAVRLLHWQDGMVTEPHESLYEIDPGRWRDYDAYAGHPSPAPGGLHVGEFDQRLEEWRHQFLRATARSLAARLEKRGWDQFVLAGEPPVTAAFREELPASLTSRVIAVVEANLLREETALIADRLGPVLAEARLQAGRDLLKQAVGQALAGGAAALGWPEVMDSLVQQRVRHLLLDPAADVDPAQLDPVTREALGSPPRPMVAERAVEQAVTSGAEVTTLPPDTPELAHAGGAAALLRY
jgi:Bacterial archaeo-eukaryotic release factor family 10